MIDAVGSISVDGKNARVCVCVCVCVCASGRDTSVYLPRHIMFNVISDGY